MFHDQGNTHLIDLEKTFLEACRKSDYTKVRACLDLGVNVNAEDSNYEFGLILAVLRNDIELCEMLLGHPGIHVNQTYFDDYTGERYTPLMMSCVRGHEEITQKLVSHPEICLDIQYDLGYPAAFMAVKYGHIGCVRILSMQNDVNWNLFPNGDTVLTYTLKERKTDVAKLILSIPNLDIDIDHLKRQGVHEAAVDLCKQGGASYQLAKLLNSNNRPECPVLKQKKY